MKQFNNHFAIVGLLGLILVSAASGQQLGKCPDEGLSFLADVNCRKYYICSDGVALQMTCPEGLFFNPEFDECDYEVNVKECDGGTRAPEPTTTPAPGTILTQCGETVVSNAGVIEYKLGERYDENERCAFIIRSVNNSGFTFTLEENGLTEDSDVEGGPIVIFSFGHEGHTDTAHLGPPNPLTSTYVYGSIAVVVFQSERLRGSGFKLTFNAVGYWDNQFKNGVDITSSNVPGFLFYPEDGQNYTTDEATIIVVSNNDKSLVNWNEILQINITNVDIEQCFAECRCDHLTVYNYYYGALEEHDRICNGNQEPEELVYQTDGIFILFFQTDDTQNRRGFSAFWTIVEPDEVMKSQKLISSKMY